MINTNSIISLIPNKRYIKLQLHESLKDNREILYVYDRA